MQNQSRYVYSYVWLCPECDLVSDIPYCPECRKKLDFIKNTFLLRNELSKREKNNLFYI